jgi:hypothetical protein
MSISPFISLEAAWILASPQDTVLQVAAYDFL